jgi:predicted nucleotidyltransferase
MSSLDSLTPTREQILATVDAHADELRCLGGKSLAIFGSMARGEGSDSSDIDILVELQPKPSTLTWT